MPDDLPFRVDRNELFTQSRSVGYGPQMFAFHQIFENFGALWHMIMMMKSLKLKDKDGNEFTAWDAYDDHGNWAKGERGVVQYGDTGNTRILTELDALEIKNLKRAYEKLHGSYRREERSALDATLIGHFLMQFKRYFYSYMKNLFASPYKDMTVGKYVVNGQRPDGMPQLEWHKELMEGQMRVLGASMMSLLTSKQQRLDYMNNAEYDDTVNKYSRRKQLGHLMNTGLWFGGLWMVYAFMWPDDKDKKGFIAKQFNQLVTDISMGLSPRDVFQTIEKPVAAAERISKVGEAFNDFIWRGAFQGKTTREGWPIGLKTLARNVPPFTTMMQ